MLITPRSNRTHDYNNNNNYYYCNNYNNHYNNIKPGANATPLM